jgi:hypothetical protein
MIWVFALLAILAANVLPFNYKIYAFSVGLAEKLRGGQFVDSMNLENDQHGHEERNIVILGFHKIAAMLIQTLTTDAPELINKLHVVDSNEKILAKLKEKGVTAAYGDITCGDVLEHAVHGQAKLVLILVPDTLLRGTSNRELLKVAQRTWPECKVITNSDNPVDTEHLYKKERATSSECQLLGQRSSVSCLRSIPN